MCAVQYVDNAEVLPDAAREALQGQSQQGEALRPSPAAPQQVWLLTLHFLCTNEGHRLTWLKG